VISPDDEERPFVARWNALVRILLVESSVKLVALAAMQYADFHDGTSCHPGNPRLSRDTGYSEKTVRTAWQVMRGLGMADRVRMGVPHRNIADEYELHIPDHWATGMPVLGPLGRAFTCLFCGKEFNPQGHSIVRKDGRVAWRVHEFAFCPAPRGVSQSPCCISWDTDRAKAGKARWHEQDNKTIWSMFRRARGDDWPA
jgi:ribosomal protein L24E